MNLSLFCSFNSKANIWKGKEMNREMIDESLEEACPICNSIIKKTVFQLIGCQTCGHVFKIDKAKKSEALIAQNDLGDANTNAKLRLFTWGRRTFGIKPKLVC